MIVCIIWTVKGFIKSKHGKYNICLNMLEVLIHGNESLYFLDIYWVGLPKVTYCGKKHSVL